MNHLYVTDIHNTTQHRSKSEERMAKFLALQNDSQASQSSATVYDRLDLHVNEVCLKTNSFIVVAMPNILGRKR